MSISFDWYENPRTNGQQDEPAALHPRIRLNGSVGTAQLAAEIQQATSLTRGDVRAALEALSQAGGSALADGQRVHLVGIGYFAPVLECVEPVTRDTKRKTATVRLKAIRFQADKQLRAEVGRVQVEPLNLRNLSASLPTDDELQRRVAAFLKENGFMRRMDFQRLCGLSRTTATRRLHKLCEDGFLVNRGTLRQPVYVAVMPQEQP